MTDQEISQQKLLDQNLGMLFGRTRRALRREYDSAFAPMDLTVPQVHVLYVLSLKDEIPISQLSSEVCSDSPTVTSLLDRMEAKGLIERKRDTVDRRVVRVHITDHGREINDAVGKCVDSVWQMVHRRMSKIQLNQLYDLMLLLCETVEQGHGGDDCSHNVA